MDFSFPANKPAWLSPFIPILLLLAFSAPLFSGCARDGGGSIAANTSNDPAQNASAEGVKKATPLAAVSVEDNLQPSEGDLAIESEIKALERSGKWGNKDDEPAMARRLDMSKYDFPVVLNNQVAAYLDMFQGEQHDMFQRWLARSTKYLPIIKRELAKAGLPQDLAYLSMIESGYTPTARSSAGAVGLWQFMRDTGKQYTLRIDNYIDERRHIEKSTKAAVSMLSDLYNDFGDWHLAVAAYNSGPARVQNGLARFDDKTFWELADESYLPLETKRYVPKLIAAIIIAKDPKKYGFDNVPYQPEFDYDRLTVTSGLTLDAVALVAGCNAATIKSLNPELHRGIIPPNAGRYVVRIPVGSKDLASRNLALLHTFRATKYSRHVVKRRENIATICNYYGVSRASLLKANSLRSAHLRPGQTLSIPHTVTSYALGSGKAANTIAAALRDEVPAVAWLRSGKTKEIVKRDRDDDDTDLYLVKNGETLWSIAKKHNVSMEQIKKWNNLKSSAIHAGLRLKISEA